MVESVKRLMRNGIRVDREEKIIELGSTGPGLKMWAEIDRLCHYFGYRWVRY